MMWRLIIFFLCPLLFGLELYGASGSVVLSNEYFQLSSENHVMMVSQEGPSVDEARALTLWKILNKAILEVKAQLNDDLFLKINFPIKVKFDFQEGCNALWDGEFLLFFKGTNLCASSAIVPSIVVHELGHALAQQIYTKKIILSTDLNEAFADSFAAIILNSPLMGEGFNHKQFPQYLRDLSIPFSFPDDWRGNYSGSLIVSTLCWDLFGLLKENLSLSKSKSIMLNTLFVTLGEIKKSTIPDFSLLMVDKIKEKFINDLWIDQILIRHGFKMSLDKFDYHFTTEGIRFRFPKITNGTLKINQLSFPILKDENEKVIRWSSLKKLAKCGQEISLFVMITQKTSQIHRSYPSFLVRVGDIVRYKRQVINLSNEVTIPDQGKLEFPFHFEVKETETILRLMWKGNVDHLYSDDLRLAFFNQNQFFGGLRGTDERKFATEYDLTRELGNLKRVNGKLRFQDIGKDFEGKIISNTLVLETLNVTCQNHKSL